jgi:hypothetical protein
MTAQAAALCRVGWRANDDTPDVALAVNRLLAAGARAWWITDACDGADAGDYLVEVTRAQRAALADFGVHADEWRGALDTVAQRLTAPATCLFAGTASKFPYYAYYALALLRLGIDYVPCDGAALARGALDDANLLVLPGGFSTWGIDAAESAPGADAQVRKFLAHGGTAIGSCGGAYYLSAGRPAWTGTAPAKPLYTHEYLQSGVGIVTLRMRAGPLAAGLPPTVEVPYYHGPIYDVLGPGVEVAATFHSLSLPGRLAIDNPLDDARFRRDMADRPAILLAHGDRGRAVLFSPHPEMGDLVRKYIALDGYVRRYLPIRGFDTMRDTLRHYRVTDSPSFRLVLNAVHHVMRDARQIEGKPRFESHPEDLDFLAACRRALAAVPALAQGQEADLERDVQAGIRARLDDVTERAQRVLAGDAAPRLRASRAHLVSTLSEHLSARTDATPAQALMEGDLAVALLDCWTRVAEFDRALVGA